MSKRKMIKLYMAATIGFALAAATVFLIPLSQGEDTFNNVISIMAGCFFWIGMIIGIVSYYIIRKYARSKMSEIKKCCYRPAIITFFVKPIAFVSDIVFLVSLLVLVLGSTVVTLLDVIYIFAMFCCIFTFSIHFLFNGMIFKYIFLKKEGE